MSDFAEAARGALGLIIGGIILLVFVVALDQSLLIDLNLWGVIYVIVGIVVAVVAVGVGLMATVGEL